MYRACERFKIDPDSWEEFSMWKQALFIAYNQIREYEESEERVEFFNNIAKMMGAR